MARYHGKQGQVKIGPKIVLSLNKWNLDLATDKADVTAFGDSNKVYVQGLKDLKGSVSGWFDSAEDALFVAADATSPITMELLPVSSSTIKWTGPAWLDAAIDCPVNGPVTVSGDFVAAGAWSRTFTVVAATGATAGTPGTFTPAGAVAPQNLAAMTGVVTATPATAWTTGQHVVLGDLSKAYWNATAWVTGQAAVMEAEAAAAKTEE